MLLLLTTSPAAAEFRLLSTDKAADSYTVEFIPREAMPGTRSETRLIPGPDGEHRQISLEGPAPDLGRESFLLAIPPGSSDDAADWQVSIGSADAANGTALTASPGALSVTSARMGAVPFLQVTVDPALFEPARAERLTLELTSRNKSANSLLKSLEPGTEAGAIARAVALNPDDVSAVASSAAKGPAPLPPLPPGELRLEFGRGDRLVEITAADLGITGPELADVAFAYEGALLPVAGIEADSVWLWVPDTQTKYDRGDAMFATPGAAVPSPVVSARPAFDTLTPAGSEVALTRTQRWEEEIRYEQIVVVQGSDHFMWHKAIAPPSPSFPSSHTQNVSFEDVLTSLDVDVRFSIIAQNQDVFITPDHSTDFSVEGVTIPRITWDGATILEQTESITLPAAPAGSISFTHTIPGAGDNPVVDAGGSDQQRFDWFELTWTGYPRAENGERLLLEVPEDTTDPVEPQRVTVGGFAAGTTAADLAVLEVSDPLAPVRLTSPSIFTDTSGTVAVEFEAPATGGRFLVQRIDSAITPDVFPSRLLPPLPAETLAGFIVYADALDGSASDLATLRGPGIVSFTAGEAFDAFGGGRHSPEAIRDALAWYVANAPARDPLPFVVLVGHGTIDVRDTLGLSSNPEVPLFIEESVRTAPGWLENGVDYFYSLVEGADELPDLRIARIPAKTAADVQIAIDRILAHEAQLPALAAQDRTGVFVAGRDFGFQPLTFITDQPRWIGLWESDARASVRIDKGTSNPSGEAEFLAIEAALEDTPGASYIQYMGHGFINNWENSRMMASDKVPQLATENRWPVAATFTCFNGFFAFPGSPVPSLAEAWLFADASNGAVAALAPVSVDFYLEQSFFADEFLKVLTLPDATRPETIGGILTAAQASFAAQFPGFDKTLHEYTLFGDPAMPWEPGTGTASFTGWQAF